MIFNGTIFRTKTYFSFPSFNKNLMYEKHLIRLFPYC